MRKFTIATVLYFSIAACSARPTSTGAVAKSRDFITYEEIQSARVVGPSSWHLIAELRPHFLRSHSAQSLTERDPVFAAVYVDELLHGNLESLKSLTKDGIMSVQFLSPYDATTRFGTAMAGGAILIRTH
ncbi:MAG: hypothetical protein ABI681_10660 [Gemmatimonadales bacterium]